MKVVSDPVTYYKFTSPGRRSTHADNGFVWPAPSGKRPGKWTDHVSPVVPCASGYHLTTAEHLLSWTNAELWVAEGRGLSVVQGDKVAFESVRLVRRVDAWNEQTAREFACWCAESVLYLIPEPYRAMCANTIDVARRFSAGEASRSELSAARTATLDAVWDATWAAAGAAARATTWDAARAATWDAAWAAARSAAWAAARTAAGDAARAAARDAAGDAQTTHLFNMLGLDGAS